MPRVKYILVQRKLIILECSYQNIKKKTNFWYSNRSVFFIDTFDNNI